MLTVFAIKDVYDVVDMDVNDIVNDLDHDVDHEVVNTVVNDVVDKDGNEVVWLPQRKRDVFGKGVINYGKLLTRMLTRLLTMMLTMLLRTMLFTTLITRLLTRMLTMLLTSLLTTRCAFQPQDKMFLNVSFMETMTQNNKCLKSTPRRCW